MRNTLLATTILAVVLCGVHTAFGDDAPAEKPTADPQSQPKPAEADAFVPFVIPIALAKDSPIAWPAAQPIAPDSPRVRVKGRHFVLGEDGKEQYYRAWGVNTCFGANVPTHAEAERTAARMASLGINSVRIHHLDSANYPDGIWNKEKPEDFHPEALDRLDYFIDQLAKNGIRINLNLHVGRAHGRVLNLPAMPGNNYDKMLNIFTPQLVDAQKTYAKNLLTRENKYRKTRYADDAAIAFIEINNEDSLFMWGWRNSLRHHLPPFYADILREQFIVWLKARYENTDKLRAAWDVGSSPLGETMVPALAEPGSGEPGTWYLERHEKCTASIKATKDGVRIAPGVTNATVWHLQYNSRGLKFEDGKYYTLIFRIRADKPRTIEFNVAQAHEPWHSLGVSGKIDATEQWQEIRRGFIAPDEDNGRVMFCFSGDATAFELADVTLCPGGEEGLAEDETLEAGNVAVFPVSSAPTRLADTMLFLVETEKAYWDGMYAYIKKDLKCDALVTGTNVFGPGNLYAQSDMDYLDGHAYWEHPHFPRKQWDWQDWEMRQRAMVDNPGLSILSRLAAERLEGKPFTVSEYNHPAPQDTQAECVPMLAAFAAAQDWDGVWLFAYSHRGGALQNHFASFFDIDANPAKLGFMPAGAAMFRQGMVRRLFPERLVIDKRGDNEAMAMARRQASFDYMPSVLEPATKHPLGTLTLRNRISAAFMDPPQSGPEAPPRLTWEAKNNRYQFLLRGFAMRDNEGDKVVHTSTGAIVFVGRGASPGEVVSLTQTMDGIWDPEKFSAVTITPLDGKNLEESSRILITACGRCENVDMGFNADRTSVGGNWGKGPVRIEAVTAQITLPGGGNWICDALKSDGSIRQHGGNLAEIQDHVVRIDANKGGRRKREMTRPMRKGRVVVRSKRMSL